MRYTTRLRGRLGVGLWLLAGLAGCGDLDPADFREMVVGFEGGRLRISGITLDIPTAGGPAGVWGERTFTLFHPPSVPAPPAGRIRVAVGIGPGDFVFTQPARVTARIRPAIGSDSVLQVFRLDLGQGSYTEVLDAAIAPAYEGAEVQFEVRQGGVFVLTERAGA